MQVEPAWYGALSKVSSRHQWTRCALATRHFLSKPNDSNQECSSVGGKFVAGAVKIDKLSKLSCHLRDNDGKQKSAATEKLSPP